MRKHRGVVAAETVMAAVPFTGPTQSKDVSENALDKPRKGIGI
jgi:hypothetical protein